VSILAVFPKLFNRRWWLTTIFVILGVIVLVKLGFWQLDRLQQKRDINALMSERWKQEPFDLNTQEIPSDLEELEYRHVQATGKFDYAHQILLSHQTYNETPGSILVTPLILDDGRAILVARGWIPTGEDAPENWSKYQEPEGAPVIGLIKESQLLPNGSAPTPPKAPQTEWYQINVDAIQPQMPYKLMPVLLQQLPEEGRTINNLPLREDPALLDESEHFSYAIQWYSFAVILGIGYFFFIRTQELRDQALAGKLQEDASREIGGETEITTMSQSEGHA
jgi:surfeit locus 1 family protein